MGERNLFGLAPGGFTKLFRSLGILGSSYLAFSPYLWNSHSRHSTGRYVFCGTFLTPNSVLQDSGTVRIRTTCPVELGLSSPPDFPLWVNSGGATICSLRLPLSFLICNPSLDCLICQTVCLFVLLPWDGLDLKGVKVFKFWRTVLWRPFKFKSFTR